MKHIVSFSGGKDSTALLLKLLEENKPINDIVFFDTGWEFPELIEHVYKIQDYIKRKITILKPKHSFEYWMFKRPIKARKGPMKGKIHRIGNGWPSPVRRWCTREKTTTIDRYIKQKYGKFYYQYIGFAADEIKRTGCGNACEGEIKDNVNRLYPLISEWDMDEKECLNYCYSKGFDWEGLYKLFKGVSCFCCPLQRIGNFRILRKHYPKLWKQMLEWDSNMPSYNKPFLNGRTVHDLEKKFSKEITLNFN